MISRYPPPPPFTHPPLDNQYQKGDHSRPYFKIIPKTLVLFVMIIGLLILISKLSSINFNYFSKATTNPSFLLFTPDTMTAFPQDTISTRIFLFPEGNTILGTDIILQYDPALLTPPQINLAKESPLGSLTTQIDPQTGIISITAIAFDGNNQTNPPTNQAFPLVDLIFNIPASSSATITTLTFDYTAGSTTDSNIAALDNQSIIEVLDQPNRFTLTIQTSQSLGDFDTDQDIDFLDYTQFMTDFNPSPGQTDPNNDPNLNIININPLFLNFGQNIPLSQ